MTGITVPSNSPLDGTVHTCQFSDDWLPIITGALSDLYIINQWESPPVDIVAQVDELINLIEANVIIAPQIYPSFAQHSHAGSKVETGNALVFTINTGQYENGWWLQSTAAINDSFHFDLLLQAGTYTIKIIGMKAPNNGILSLTMDFEDYLQTDWYAASNALNTVQSHTGVYINQGLTRFTGIVATKNGSSSGYNMRLNKFLFIRDDT